MVNKTSLWLFAFIAIIALGGLVWTINPSLTGSYSASGGGRYYYGPQPVQLSPQDACKYAGCGLSRPITIYTNEFGVKCVVCDCGFDVIGVPMVQTSWVY